MTPPPTESRSAPGARPLAGRVRTRCEPGCEALRLEALPWRDPAALEARCERVLHLTPKRQVVALRFGPDGRLVFCKRYVPDSWRALVSALLRGSRARREWRTARRAAARSLAVVRPVAVLERCRGPLAVESAIATEPAEGAGLQEAWLRASSPAARAEILSAAGAFVRRLHDAGLWHGDLTARNLLARRTPEGWAFTVIDLANASLRGRVRPRARAKDLYQLLRMLVRAGLGPGGRLRLLRAYLAAGGGGDAGPRAIRRLWRGVEGFLARRRRRGERKRRREGRERPPHADAGPK